MRFQNHIRKFQHKPGNHIQIFFSTILAPLYYKLLTFSFICSVCVAACRGCVCYWGILIRSQVFMVWPRTIMKSVSELVGLSVSTKISKQAITLPNHIPACRSEFLARAQSPDFYANLRTRFVGRFGGISRKICTKIYYLRQLLLSFLENYHKLSKTILDNHHRQCQNIFRQPLQTI